MNKRARTIAFGASAALALGSGTATATSAMQYDPSFATADVVDGPMDGVPGNRH